MMKGKDDQNIPIHCNEVGEDDKIGQNFSWLFSKLA